MPSHNTAILLELMYEYANLQCECSNKVYVVVGEAVVVAAQGGCGGDTLTLDFSSWAIVPTRAFNETGVKGLPQLQWSRQRWDGRAWNCKMLFSDGAC